MIKVNLSTLEKIKALTDTNYYVVADFDKTITTKDSNTTLSLFAKSGLYPEEYLIERTKNHSYYRPLEIDPSIPHNEKYNLMKEWAEKSFALLEKYKIREKDIDIILKDKSCLTLRDGAIDFIKTLNEKGIPLLISSSGCGNFVKGVLEREGCNLDSIYIHSNMLNFVNGVVKLDGTRILHAMNKNCINLSLKELDDLKGRDTAVIIGDQISDAKMAEYLPKKDEIKIGFLESNVEENKDGFEREFGVILTGNESFEKIKKLINGGQYERI